MTLDNFKKFQSTIDKSIKWNEETIFEMETKLGKLYQDVLNLLFAERVIYENMITEKNELYGKFLHDVKFSIKSQYKYDTKAEIDSQINREPEYKKLCIDLNLQGAMIEYMDNTLKNISSISYQIRDYIKWKMFKSGASF